MEENIARDFKGIWIPKEIWLSKDLSIQEKVFLVEINSLDGSDGCFASNNYFSSFFGLSKSRCSEIIKSIEKKGYISIVLTKKYNSKEVDKRVIRCIRKTEEGYSENRRGVFGKPKDNNTLSNNTISNINIYSLVVEYLNKKIGTSYKANSKKTKSLINARLNDGYVEEDFKTVIDKKTTEWLGNSEMQKFLRPETLFGTKFESYLNQKDSKGGKNGNWNSTVGPNTQKSKFGLEHLTNRKSKPLTREQVEEGYREGIFNESEYRERLSLL